MGIGFFKSYFNTHTAEFSQQHYLYQISELKSRKKQPLKLPN